MKKFIKATLTRFRKPILIALLFQIALLLLFWAIYTADEPRIDGIGLGYISGENQTQNTEAQIDINNPRSCIPCHKTIYDEWFNSYHRYAHEDIIFRFSMVFKDGKAGIPWCENCHISESTLEVDPLKQPVSRRDAKSALRLGDGIDCASCHRRGNQIVGKHGTNIGCKAVGDSNFGTPKYCGGCHSSFLPKTIHEYEEWLQNPKPVSIKKTCVQCHMPNIAGSKLDGISINKS
ncbi:MAG: hypothetical protein KAR20_27655, partial [Candidatus Heimdallarchaeota archaeon]|nr:hypothetical protein [Candidatus Heimdallarchaeota archaeon]